MPESTPKTRPSHVPPAVVAVLLMAAFALLGGAFILSQRLPARVFYDQELYHLVAIRQFAAQWPNFDFWHYLSATTPGYHLLMAAVARFISPSTVVLQVASMTISVALIGLLGYACVRRTSPLLGAAFCIPFLLCRYVTGSAAWLLPDNIAWLGVLSILLIALRPRLTPGAMIAGGAILLGLVFVRQIHIWTAGLLWASAYLSDSANTRHTAPTPESNQEPSLKRLFLSNFKFQISNSLLCLLFTLPAFTLLLLFIRYWGGPVPPVFQQWFHTYNLSAVVFILSLFGVWGVFFAATWLPHLLRFWRTSRAGLVTTLLIVLAFGLAVPTNDFAAARHTGLWGVAERCPTIGHTSPLMLGLMLLGALPVASLLFAAPIRQRIIFLAAILGFAAANTTNNDLFQRYVDPFALMLLALMSATANGNTQSAVMTRGQKLQLIGPMVLAAILSLISFRDVMRNYNMISDPPPPPRTLSIYDNPNDPNSKPAPCELPRPAMPPGKHFWPWS